MMTRYLARRGLLAVVLGCLVSTGHADSQRVVEFGYDAAGNLVRIDTQIQSGAPIIHSIEPEFINPGLTQAFTVTGSNLLSAELSVSNPGLVPRGITTTPNEVRFFLSAALDLALGPSLVRLTTALGQADATLEVGTRLPKLSSVPSPMVVTANSAPVPFTIQFDTSVAEDRTLTLSTGDATLAGVTPTTVLLPGGQRVFTVEIAGAALGNTSLDVSNPDFIAPVSLPLAVSASFSGQGELQSHAVGVHVFSADGSGPIVSNTAFAQVGVRVGGAQVLPGTRVGVRVGGVQVLPGTRVGVVVGGFRQDFQALPVGIEVGGQLAGTISQPPLVGVIVGPMLFAASPASVSGGTDIEVLITGVNLDSVDSVTLSPPDGITPGTTSSNLDGTELTVPLSVIAGAEIGVRQIKAVASGQPVPVFERTMLEIEIE